MAAKRVGLSRRLRFEVLKRDGFRCKYCGATAASVLLVVDHVEPVVKGGPTSAPNLVTACADCNAGKGPIPLGESQLAIPHPTEDMLEHAEQMLAYLDAVKQRQIAKDALLTAVKERWEDALLGRVPFSLAASFRYWIETIGLDRVWQAIDILADVSSKKYMSEDHKCRYINATMRNLRDGVGPGGAKLKKEDPPKPPSPKVRKRARARAAIAWPKEDVFS